jgi:hypothetical protein
VLTIRFAQVFLRERLVGHYGIWGVRPQVHAPFARMQNFAHLMIPPPIEAALWRA